MNPLKTLIVSIILVTLLNIILSKNSKHIKRKIQWPHYLFGYFFVLYILITLVLVGFPTLWEWKLLLNFNKPIFNPHINLVPFIDGFGLTYILNIILFMPLGFFLGSLWEKYRNKLLSTICYGLFFSLTIEISQLFVGSRTTDIDDIITNVLETICGWLIFNILRKFFCKFADKTVVNISSSEPLAIKLEPYLYLPIAMLCVFLG